MVILFEYKGKRILFTGDVGKRGWDQVFEYCDENGIDLHNLDIIKMPHHGSRKNVNPDIMDSIGKKGTRCIISCISGDEGHHPSKRLVNMLKKKGFWVYITGGKNIRYHIDAPPRQGYFRAKEMNYYPKMEKL